MFPNLKWIPREHKPCMEDLHNMMQTRAISLGKSDPVKISWPLQQCATWLASHPPLAASNASPVRAWDCLGLLSCGAAGDVATAKYFFTTPPFFIVLVPPLHCLGDHAIQVSGDNGSGSGSSGGSGPSPSASSSKRRHSKIVAGNAQVRF
jgi:hypothetical protein